MTNQSFDNEVKQKLSGHESPVPDGMWEAIAEKKKKRRYPFFWWLTSAGVLATLITGVIIARPWLASLDKKTTAPIAKKSATSSNDRGTKDKYDTIHTESATNPVTAALSSGQANDETSPVDIRTKKTISYLPGIDTNISINNAGGSKAAKKKETAITPVIQPKSSSGRSSENNDAIVQIEVQPGGKVKRPGKTIAGSNTSDKINENGLASTFETSKETGSSMKVSEEYAIEKNLRYATHPNNDMPGINKFLQFSSPAKHLPDSSIKQPVLAIKAPSGKNNWSVDVGLSFFQPLRQKQALASINRVTNSNSNMHVAQYRADTIQSNLQPAFAYTIAVQKRINKRLLIGAGIQYGVMKEHLVLKGRETHTDYQVVQRLENGSLRDDTVAVVTAGTRTIDAINSYRFLDIPLSLQYVVIEKSNLSLRITGGVNLGLYSRYNNSIEGNLQAVYSSGTAASKQPAGFRTEFYTGFRISRRLLNRVDIYAEPYLRFNAGKYANTVINNRAVHQAGIRAGLIFQFVK